MPSSLLFTVAERLIKLTCHFVLLKFGWWQVLISNPDIRPMQDNILSLFESCFCRDHQHTKMFFSLCEKVDILSESVQKSVSWVGSPASMLMFTLPASVAHQQTLPVITEVLEPTVLKKDIDKICCSTLYCDQGKKVNHVRFSEIYWQNMAEI